MLSQVASAKWSQVKASDYLAKCYKIIDEYSLDELTNIVDVPAFIAYILSKDCNLTWEQMQRFISLDAYMTVLVRDYPNVLNTHREAIIEHILDEGWYRHSKINMLQLLFTACEKGD